MTRTIRAVCTPQRNDHILVNGTNGKGDHVADVIGPNLNGGFNIWTQNGRCIAVDATKDPDVWQERTAVPQARTNANG